MGNVGRGEEEEDEENIFTRRRRGQKMARGKSRGRNRGATSLVFVGLM